MDLGDTSPLRQECWDAMSETVRSRLLERAGTLIDWWSVRDYSSEDGRAEAVVFGDRALCLAEPRINAEHRPVYALSAYLLDPGSLRRVSIDHRPGGPRLPPGHGPAGGPGLGVNLGLSDAARGILGNLPPRAQELLQAPFHPEQRVLRCDWHYEGFEHRLRMFMIYLAGARHVTVATGTKVIPAGHDAASAHWELSCFRASVVRRIGT